MKEEMILTGSAAVSGVLTLILTIYLIRRFKKKGITGRDVHKKGRVVAEMGGLGALLGFFAGIFFILFFLDNYNPLLIASAFAALGTCILGIIDDLMELRQRVKGLLPFFFGLPLALTLTVTEVHLPFYGMIEFGYVLIILIPLCITCAANSTNMLEGLNGLSVGMNIFMGAVLCILAVFYEAWATVFLLVPFLCAITVFLLFNKYPAKVFPGDTLTLSMGAVMAAGAIIGNLYFYAFILYLPFILEFVLKFTGKLSRSGLKKWGATPWGQSFGKLTPEGTLKHEGRIESLVHIPMKYLNLREYQIVFLFWFIEAFLAGVCIVIYYLSA